MNDPRRCHRFSLGAVVASLVLWGSAVARADGIHPFKAVVFLEGMKARYDRDTERLEVEYKRRCKPVIPLAPAELQEGLRTGTPGSGEGRRVQTVPVGEFDWELEQVIPGPGGTSFNPFDLNELLEFARGGPTVSQQPGGGGGAGGGGGGEECPTCTPRQVGPADFILVNITPGTTECQLLADFGAQPAFVLTKITVGPDRQEQIAELRFSVNELSGWEAMQPPPSQPILAANQPGLTTNHTIVIGNAASVYTVTLRVTQIGPSGLQVEVTCIERR